VPSPVLKDIDEGVAHLAGRPERARVKAVPPHASSPAEGPIDALREADGETLDAPRERASTVGLDDQVEMVALHRELKDPESTA